MTTIFDLIPVALPIVVAFDAGLLVALLAAAIGDERRKAQAQAMNLSLTLRPVNDASYFD